ncbi:MAG: hypothetical protein M3322_03255, partial [Actinomycetota bacterium]|nr:hypothetical protein [Actinomycetota bacterium]
MASVPVTSTERRGLVLPGPLARRFEAVVCEWDGTAVPDAKADASEVRGLIERLCALGMDVFIVTRTDVENVDGQLAARPRGPGRLYLCLNRGSEVFEVGEHGVELVAARTATPEEEAALTAAAEATVAELAARGLRAEVVAQRLDRGRIDLIPEPAWADPPKARITDVLTEVEGRLRSSGIGGLPEAIELAARCARASGLADPRVTSDAKHVEIGLTDRSDSARWAFAELWRRGVSPTLVVVAGDEFGSLGGVPGTDSLLLVPEASGAVAFSVGAEPTGTPTGVIALGGGPAAFAAVLEDQVDRRERRDVPDVAEDPGWTLEVDGLDPELERSHETLLVLADGRFGTSGGPAWSNPYAAPRVLVGGVYDGDGPTTDLISAPTWQVLSSELPAGERLRRVLDLRTGILRQTVDDAAALLFSSFARPGTALLRAQGPAALVAGDVPLSAPPGADAVEGHAEDGVRFSAVPASEGGVAAAASEITSPGRLERTAAYVADPVGPPDPEDAVVALVEAQRIGFDALVREHRSMWASRWEDADVMIRGDDELQLAVRFALFHLMGSTASSGEAAVGARGLTGPGYRGHVFWDTDIFVLPFLAATHPPAARAILEYRIRRLPAALEAARALGLAGARFPWESARAGVDVTPPYARDQTGRIIPIRT